MIDKAPRLPKRLRTSRPGRTRGFAAEVPPAPGGQVRAEPSVLTVAFIAAPALKRSYLSTIIRSIMHELCTSARSKS